MALGEGHALSGFSSVSSDNLMGLQCSALISEYLPLSWHWHYFLKHHGCYKMEGEWKACWEIEHNACHTVQNHSVKGRGGEKGKPSLTE